MVQADCKHSVGHSRRRDKWGRALQDREEIAAEEAAPGVDLDDRNELVRLAALTSATVQVIEDHPGLERAGGVGALLRYRPG